MPRVQNPLLERITIDPDVRSGKPCIRGHRITVQEILEYCHVRMARYKVPKYVEFRRELPKSLVGKVLRRQLLEQERGRQAVTHAS